MPHNWEAGETTRELSRTPSGCETVGEISCLHKSTTSARIVKFGEMFENMYVNLSAAVHDL